MANALSQDALLTRLYLATSDVVTAQSCVSVTSTALHTAAPKTVATLTCEQENSQCKILCEGQSFSLTSK